MATEKRLIDASELDSKLEALAQKYAAQGRFEVAKDYSFVQTVLLTAPTVDAVEVVRCKDCEYGCEDHEDAYLCNNGFNGLIGFTRGDDFCSYGERKEA